MAKVKLSAWEKRQKQQKEVAEHLISLGWIANNSYLDGKVSNKYDGDLKRIAFGLWMGKYYLITKCGTHACTVSDNKIEFWRIKPTFYKLGKFSISSKLKLTERGFSEVKTRGEILSTTIEINLQKFINQEIKEDI